jgi:branched-chain amino acid transport system ATP-binding protein
MLEVTSLSRNFGGLHAVRELSFRIAPGEFLGVMGPNGAGKTTLLNLITGYLRPSAGSIDFQGRSIAGRRPFEICRMGIARTFQVVRPFGEMSVLDNVIAGALFSRARGVSLADARERARIPLELTGLWQKRAVRAGGLSIGEKKKLELARALATEPRLLLLDEVVSGLTESEMEDLVAVLARIHAAGTTILMIEHIVEVILRLSNRVLVLNFGQKLFEGTPREVVAHPAVVESYLGRPLDSVDA